MEGINKMELAPRADGYFYAATLDKKGASVTWDAKNAELSERLIIKQILLGHTAKENEYNVVEVETISVEDPVKIPIAVLKVGETRLAQPALEFPDGPVTFTLIEGSGPVYIHGQQAPSAYTEDVVGEEEFMTDEEIDGEEDVDDEESTDIHPSKKQKTTANNAKSVGNNKTNNSNKKK